jgi:hypothetical protein
MGSKNWHAQSSATAASGVIKPAFNATPMGVEVIHPETGVRPGEPDLAQNVFMVRQGPAAERRGHRGPLVRSSIGGISNGSVARCD